MKTIIEVVIGGLVVVGLIVVAYKKYAAAKVSAAITEVKAVATEIEKNV